MKLKAVLITTSIALAGCHTTTDGVQQTQAPAAPAAAQISQNQSVALNRLLGLSDLETFGQLGIAGQIQDGCPRAKPNAQNYNKVRKKVQIGVKLGRTQAQKQAAFETAKQGFAKKYGKPLGANMDYCAVLTREQKEQTALSAFFKPL